MSANIVVVDYGIGNLFSVMRAFEKIGVQATLSSDPEVISGASRLVLPGVGAFADCVTALKTRKLDQPVVEFTKSKKPFLGICVGLQMLFDSSDEFGSSPGLGIIPGVVRGIPTENAKGERLKVPHIGWSELQPAGSPWANSILDGLPPQPAVYFVHSFHAVPKDPNVILATCDFHGHKITAAVRQGSVFGTQFHPEKSGPVGLQILQKFVSASF